MLNLAEIALEMSLTPLLTIFSTQVLSSEDFARESLRIPLKQPNFLQES